MYWWNLYYMWVVSFKLLYSSAGNISYLSRAVTKIACSWLLVGGELNKSKFFGSTLLSFFKVARAHTHSSHGKSLGPSPDWNPVLKSHLVYLNIAMVQVWPRLELRSPPNPKSHTLLITTSKPPHVLQLTIFCIFIGYHLSCENVTKT